MSRRRKHADDRAPRQQDEFDPWVPTHRFKAGLRVAHVGDRHDEITRVTGLAPTHAHRIGEYRPIWDTNWTHDLWSLKSPLPEAEPLAAHLAWLWDQIGPHIDYFRSLIADGAKIDVFCGYLTDCDHCGFSLAPGAMKLIDALGVPLEISTMFYGHGDS